MLFFVKNFNKIKKNLKKYWNENPNAAMRDSISNVLKNNKINDIGFIKNFIGKNINNDESRKLLIEFAIYFNNWSIARENIKGLISSNPTRELCFLMSEIELGDLNYA